MIDFQETEIRESEPILFIHGLGASRWMWWQQEAAFQDYQAILVDLPGHGKSVSTPWVSLADTAKGIARHVIHGRRVHLVGISLGGHVALELAKHYPENVLSIWITGITVKPIPYRFLLKLQSRWVQRGLRNERYLEDLAERHFRLPRHKTADFIANYQLLTPETYEAIWNEIMRFHLDASYKVITAPCFIAAGEKESARIRESVEVVPQILPNAAGKIIPGAQHDWPVQNAQRFNSLLKEWLDQYRLKS